jgi:hypothetical protein
MGRSITDIQKRRGRPKTGTTPISNIRLPDELRVAVDEWRATQPDPQPSRSEAIRLILKDWLIGHGHLPFRDD